VLSAPDTPLNPADINDPDPESHGTHVAGIAAASSTSLTPGIAYNANLMVLKILPSCADINQCGSFDFPNPSVAALNYFTAQPDTKIFNASYGPELLAGTKIFATSSIDSAEAAAAQAAVTAGKIIVAANGNDRDTAPIAGSNPNGIALYPFIQPGNAKASVYDDGGNNFNLSGLLNQRGLVVAVASVGQDKTIAYYSQTCGVTASWCVTAPGGDQSKDMGIPAPLPNNNYGFLQGTSMAAPVVSGALADLQQAYSAYSGRDLAYVLFATAENIGGKLADNATYGYGLIRLDRAIAGPTTLARDTQVTVAAQQVAYWSQPLTTDGGFSLTGPGYLLIAGRTTAAGDVSATGGALGVDGTLTLASSLTVARGGMLSGIGRIVGNTTINGTLNAGQLPNYADVAANSGNSLPAGTPLSGTSPGTLTFQGNAALGATAVTRANIDGGLLIPGGPGTFDKIIVTGAGNIFTANGTLTPVLRGIPGSNNDYTPALGSQFAIVTAQSGADLAGQFTALTEPGEGLAPNTRLDVVYGASAITLDVTPLDFQALAAQQNLSPDAQAVAGAVQAARPAPGVLPASSEAGLLNDLYDNSVDADDRELTALAGEGLAANPGSVLSAFSGLSDVLAGRQATLHSPAAPVQVAFGYGNAIASDMDGGLGMTQDQGWTAWAQGLGRWSSTGADAGISGARDASTGAVLGLDRVVGDGLAVGGAFSFARTDMKSAGSVARTDIYAGAAYITWLSNDWVVDGRLAGGSVSGHTSRSVGISGVDENLTGAPGGWGLLADASAGHRFTLSGINLEPYGGLLLQIYRQNGYGETSDVGLDFAGQNFSRAQTALGVRVATAVDVLGLEILPRADIAWTHDIGNAGLSTHAAIFDQAFVIDAAQPGRDAARVSAGFSIAPSEGFSLMVGYDGEFRGNATSHQISGSIRVTF
jgi:uncharacterized protein with beta-barrel porin domain